MKLSRKCCNLKRKYSYHSRKVLEERSGDPLIRDQQTTWLERPLCPHGAPLPEWQVSAVPCSSSGSSSLLARRTAEHGLQLWLRGTWLGAESSLLQPARSCSGSHLHTPLSEHGTSARSPHPRLPPAAAQTHSPRCPWDPAARRCSCGRACCRCCCCWVSRAAAEPARTGGEAPDPHQLPGLCLRDGTRLPCSGSPYPEGWGLAACGGREEEGGEERALGKMFTASTYPHSSRSAWADRLTRLGITWA